MLPLQGTAVAGRWDSLFLFMLWLAAIMFVLVVGSMLAFVWKYRHKASDRTTYITGSHVLEAIWIIVPTVMLLGIFVWGYSVYRGMTQAPRDAVEIRVLGKQWVWSFQYDNGRTSIGEIYVPVHRPTKLIMTSEDVLHSFFIPNFRVKQDVVPGMYSSVWFKPTVIGTHQVFCAEYCGTSHSGMLAKIHVLSEADWEDWNEGKSPKAFGDSLVEQGRKLHETKGCVTCHTADGTAKLGPSHKGLFGSKVELEDGTFVIADENYIRGKIENPRGSTKRGFTQMMPTFQGLVTETEMNALIAYVKSLAH